MMVNGIGKSELPVIRGSFILKVLPGEYVLG